MAEEIKMLSRSLMQKAMTKKGFYEQFPQFGVLKAQESVYKTSRGGCGGCRKTVKNHNLFSTFTSIFLGMGAAEQARFKAFVGVDKLYFSGYNPIKRKSELTVL